MPIRVLLIDDDLHTRIILEEVLTNAGYEVECAKSGEEGVMIARNDPPDVVLIDYMLPRINGYQVALSLRRDPDMGSIPIVAMTAADLSHADRERWKSTTTALVAKGSATTLLETLRSVVGE